MYFSIFRRPADLDKFVWDHMWKPEYSHTELDPSVFAFSGQGSGVGNSQSNKNKLSVGTIQSKAFSFTDMERVNPNQFM